MKKSLLDLIPAKKGLHSAVFTTFSLDPYFLENLVRKWRSNEIVNILGVADGVMLDESVRDIYMQNNIGKSYMVLGYPSEKLLHSKIYLFVGKEKAQLIIGSGNVSMHGFGKNLETFNSFFFEGPDDPKVQLLYHCWTYLKSRLDDFDNETLFQIKWIKEEASWLENLKSGSGDKWISINSETAVSFISNNPGNGSFNQIVDLIPSKEISKLTILSPFHDQDGKSIDKLSYAFPNAKIRVILQQDYGVVPHKLNSSNVIFFEYTDIIKSEPGLKLPNHSHAKLIIFEGEKAFFIYSGSANATSAGLGIPDEIVKNEEAGILWRTIPFDIEEYFGFDFSVKQRSLSFFQKEEKQKDPYDNRILHRYFIKAAIVDNSTLNLRINKPIIENRCSLMVYDPEFCEKISLSLTPGKDSFSWQLDKTPYNDFCSVVILTEKGVPLTNKQIILNKDYLRKTNPSPKNRFIARAEEAMESGLLNDPSVLEAIIALLSINEETRNKKAVLVRAKSKGKGEEQSTTIEHTQEEIEKALKDLLESEKNDNQTARDFLESIEAATRKVLEGQHEENLENEEATIDNPDPVPPKPKDKPKPASNSGDIIKYKTRLSKIWNTAMLIGLKIMDKQISSEVEFAKELIAVNLSLYVFFAYSFNSYTIKTKKEKTKETKVESLYPDYGHLTEHESRYAIFLTLCGTAIHLLPYLKTHGQDPDLKKYVNSLVAYLAIGIQIFWERDESKQTEKETILSEIFQNLKYFFPEDNWNEIDLISLANRIMIQNNNALDIPLSTLPSIVTILEQRFKLLTNPAYVCIDELGYFRVEDHIPAGEFSSSKSLILRRVGFPYMNDHNGSTIYKRLYNKKENKFYEGARNTMSGYDKRVKK